MTMSGGGPPAPMANVLPAVTGHTVVEVTFPRRNTDAGRTTYSIKSETYDPRSSKY
jgi:hypothetical protein